MMFSICIPTLNEEKYIGGILGCLEKQTFRDFEVIVADGKSSDNTKKEVMKFSDKLPVTFLESPKRGVSFQRNYAAKSAKGKYIIFFDADVMIEDDFLQKINSYLEKEDIDILTTWNKPMSSKPIDEFIYLFMNIFMLELIKKKSPGAVGVFICVKKSSFEKIGGFRENVNFGEDFDLAKRLHDSGFTYALLKKPKIHVSVRRFDKEGRLNMIIKNLRATTYYLKDKENYIDKIQGKFKHEFGKF
ncbi:MAG TPA: glycosyltransferase [bacterium]|nr:glycosyltransferase [bacterium]HQG78820.1 glycosyltransferase [bacterium]HQK41482.1 glycosyltransferase [bacterium]